MPSTFVPFRMTSAFISIARSAAAVSVVKYGVARAGREDDDAPFSRWRTARRRMNGSATARISIARGHAGVDAHVLERVLQRQRVDDRGEHAHVVGGRAVHALGAGRQAAEQVAAADHDGGLDAELLDLGDVLGDLRGDGGVDAELLLAHESFAGELQQDAAVGGRSGDCTGYGNVAESYDLSQIVSADGSFAEPSSARSASTVMFSPTSMRESPPGRRQLAIR